MGKDKVKGKVGKCKHDNDRRDGAEKVKPEHLKKTDSSKSDSPAKLKVKVLPTCHVTLSRCDELTLAPLERSFMAITEGKNYGNNGKNGNSISGKRCKPDSTIMNRVTRFPREPTLDSPIPTQIKMKQHACQLCSKSFGLIHILKRHIQSHTGERPYKCNLCSKSFVQQGHLHHHNRTHTGERPYECQLCLKSFVHQGHLNQHIQIHTGERFHHCQVCSKSFGESRSLKKHMRAHATDNE